MTTVHLVYPYGLRIAAPDAIGRNVAKRLRENHGYEVVLHNWDDNCVIEPDLGDVLLGHPHPSPWTCFRRSLGQSGWRRILALGPYHHGDCVQVAYYDAFIGRCDLYLAITGNYWYESVAGSLFSHWMPKMVHLDLAVDRQDFPVIKTHFSPPGHRRCAYIGHSGWPKNTGFLSRIARQMPDVHFSWIGPGRRAIEGLVPYGFQDFSTESAKQLVGSHDFMITVSKRDANPSTILEAMSWGLIPVCTPQSGYVGYPGIINVPLDVSEAVEVLRRLQTLPDAQLKEMQLLNWYALDTHFNWDRFTHQVVEAIESDVSPSIQKASLLRRLKIRWCSWISPHSPVHPRNLVRGPIRRFVWKRITQRSKVEPNSI
jgi:hypothetical protein